MVNFKLELDFSSMSRDQKLAFASFVSSMVDETHSASSKPKTQASTATKKAETSAASKEAETAGKAEETSAASKKTETAETTETVTSDEVSDQDLRELMQKKVATHKDEVKAKMVELKCPNVSKLKEAGKVKEFYQFLLDLRDE